VLLHSIQPEARQCLLNNCNLRHDLNLVCHLSEKVGQHKWLYNIKLDLPGIGWEVVDMIMHL